jgi:hypothetical protein
VAARLGAQGEMFMHMHRRLMRSDAYKSYKAGRHHSQQQRESDASVTPKSAASGAVPVESDINGVLRSPAASITDFASFRRDASGPAQAVPSVKPATAAGRKHDVALSEETEFKYDPCTQTYTVGEENSVSEVHALTCCAASVTDLLSKCGSLF